jgi:hypothetical protein
VAAGNQPNLSLNIGKGTIGQKNSGKEIYFRKSAALLSCYSRKNINILGEIV